MDKCLWETTNLDRDLVNLVEYIDAWDVDSVAFYHINQLIHSRVTPTHKQEKNTLGDF